MLCYGGIFKNLFSRPAIEWAVTAFEPETPQPLTGGSPQEEQ